VPPPKVAAQRFRGNWVPSGGRSPALFFILFLEESAVGEHMTTPVPPLRWNQGKRMGVALIFLEGMAKTELLPKCRSWPGRSVYGSLSPKREKDAALLVAKIDKDVLRGFVALLMKYPYDDTDENKNPELCVAKSFSLPRKLIAAIRGRAAHLGVSMSAYVATLVKNDLVRGIDAPLSLEPGKVPTSAVGQSGRGVVVEFDLEDD
jgi:hypothetical protein